MSNKIECLIPGNVGMTLTGYENLLDLIYRSSTEEISTVLQKASELLSEKPGEKSFEETGLRYELHNTKEILKKLGEAFKELTVEPFIILEKE